MPEVGSVALLAPIPLEHLSDGVEVCTREGKVAFGSQAWETLTKFEDLGGVGAPVLIYASHNPSHVGAVVTWVARYADYVESRGPPGTGPVPPTLLPRRGPHGPLGGVLRGREPAPTRRSDPDHDITQSPGEALQGQLRS